LYWWIFHRFVPTIKTDTVSKPMTWRDFYLDLKTSFTEISRKIPGGSW